MEAKVWRAREDERVKAAKEKAMMEANLQWQTEQSGWIAKIKRAAIHKVVSFGTRFKHFVIFLSKKKHPDIDLSSINFKSMEGNKVPDRDDCVDEGPNSSLGLVDALSLESSPDRGKNSSIVNIDSS